MSLYSKISPQQQEAIDDSLTKLDFKQLHLDAAAADAAASPVSPLTIPTETTTSHSSSGSASSSNSKTNQLFPTRPDNSSADLSSFSETSPAKNDTSDSTSTLRSSRPFHRRSVSAGAPLIYSGSSFASAHNAANVATTSSASSFVPTGNICPSRKILRNGLTSISTSTSTSTSRVPDKTDNLGSRTGNPVFHESSKHLEIDFYFVRDKVKSKALVVRYIGTDDQTADVFTKPLSRGRFQLLRDTLIIRSRPAQLEGG